MLARETSTDWSLKRRGDEVDEEFGEFEEDKELDEDFDDELDEDELDDEDLEDDDYDDLAIIRDRPPQPFFQIDAGRIAQLLVRPRDRRESMANVPRAGSLVQRLHVHADEIGDVVP